MLLVFAYVMPPIDWWPGTAEFSPAEEAAIAETTSPESYALAERHNRASELARLHSLAVGAFEPLRWEGDGVWRFGAFPADQRTGLWISVKQSNDGTTFVLTPVAMPWLEATAFDVADVDAS